MNRTTKFQLLPVIMLAGVLVMVGCAGQPTTAVSTSSPAVEIQVVEPTASPAVALVEPTQEPTATLAPLPTPTPFLTSTPVPTIIFPELMGDYLGQELPGLTPVLFAEGIVSTAMNEHSIAISPDGNEIFYDVYGDDFAVILWIKRVNGVWTKPEVAPFSGSNCDVDPAFSPDGKRLFFASRRPLSNCESFLGTSFRIFYVERTSEGWSSPQSAGEAINFRKSQAFPSVAEDGTLYFSAYDPSMDSITWAIYRSKLVNGEYQAAEKLGEPVNVSGYHVHSPYIAPDQSYLIFGRNGYGYYISWQQADGAWSQPKMLNLELGLEKVQEVIWYITASPDGKVFFISANMRPASVFLPSAPPGFDLIAKQIGDPQKVEALGRIPPVLLTFDADIFWISSEALRGLED